MPGDTADVVMFGPKPIIEEALTNAGVNLHRVWQAPDADAFIAKIAPSIRAIAAAGGHGRIDGASMSRFPKLEIVSSFGVGYDHIDAKWAGEHGIIVTNTPDVLNEEVADTALGLLLCTVRHLPRAEKYLREGHWPKKGDYPLTPSMRDRTAGIVGMGRIGKAIGRRLEAMQVPVVYHSRRPAEGVGLQALSEPRRDGARRRRADRHHARRRCDEKSRQRRGAQGAGAERHPDQRGARLRGR